MANGGNFQNVFKIPELKNKILFTLALLIVYRIGVYVPTPGVDASVLKELFSGSNSILGMLNMFTGGAAERFSVFAMGIMPYISASIILQLMTVVIPHLERLSKEGEQGRKKITQYTRYGTVLISVIQGFAFSVGLEQMNAALNPGWSFRIMTVLTLTAGTAFIMWLGEQITERGIGNGISLIIFAGIVARIPNDIVNTIRQFMAGGLGIFGVIMLLIVVVGVIAIIVFVEQGQRRIPVQYAKRVVGRKMYGGQSTHLPLKINQSGVIPPIFASSLMMFPTTIANFVDIPWMGNMTEYLGRGAILYEVFFVGFIIFFCFFYTSVTFKPDDVAENMKKYGGYIPGIRPGKKTADYIDKVLTRITVGGAIYVSAICVLPDVLIMKFNVPFYFGGTSTLIMVGVAIDTVAQIESHMLSRNYEGFLKQGSIRSRSGR